VKKIVRGWRSGFGMEIFGPSFDHEAMKLSKPFHFHMKHFIYLLKNLTEKRNTAVVPPVVGQ
jgi:hypothetical protein